MANSKALGVRGLQNQRLYPVASGATFAAGDFLVLTSTGVQGVSAGSNFVPGTNPIVGRALEPSTRTDGSNLTAPYVAVILAEPGTEFLLPLYHSTPASAVPTIAMLLKSAVYELKQSSNGFPQVDLTATTNTAIRIKDIDPSDCPTWPTSVSGAVQYANVWVEFLPAASAATSVVS